MHQNHGLFAFEITSTKILLARPHQTSSMTPCWSQKRHGQIKTVFLVWLGYFGRLWPTLANFGQPWHFGPGNSRSFFFVLVLGFQLTLDFQPTRWGRLKFWDFGTKDKESHLDESLESADFSVGTHSKMQEIANVKAYQDAQLLWNQWIWARCSNEQHRATPCRTSHWNTTTFAGLLILHRLQSAITAIIAYTLYIHIIYIYTHNIYIYTLYIHIIYIYICIIYIYICINYK